MLWTLNYTHKKILDKNWRSEYFYFFKEVDKELETWNNVVLINYKKHKKLPLIYQVSSWHSTCWILYVGPA